MPRRSSTKTKSRSKHATALARYWRQVRAVQSMTGAPVRVARSTVKALREERGYQTAAETTRHPVIVKRTTLEVIGIKGKRKRRGGAPPVPPPPPPPPPPAEPYRNLADWTATWLEYEGEYDYYEVESNVDY